jgi:predicted transcriptional regulator
MKDVITQQLDEQDMEYVTLLSNIGNITIIEGKILVALSKTETLDVKTTQGICDSTQPEISIGAKALIEKGFVQAGTAEKEGGKGRPRTIYSLEMNMNRIIDIFESETIARIEQSKEDIVRLKELI